MKRKIIWILAALVGLFVLLQLIPLNKTNPPVTREVKWDSPTTRALAQRACFDCHSNETVWPWYGNIAPASILLANHVNEGRSRLNFSTWDEPNSDYQETRRLANEGEMPPWDYLLMHSTAKLSGAEKQQLLDGLKATFLQDPPIERRRRFQP